MKNLFNNMSQEEKNAIREQHTGGKKIAIENFSNMVNKKLGTVNLFEQSNKDCTLNFKSEILQDWIKGILEKGFELMKGSERSTTLVEVKTMIQLIQCELCITSDGLYGPNTVKAVRDFQKKHGLTIDGIVGDETLGKLITQYGKNCGQKSTDDSMTDGSGVGSGEGSGEGSGDDENTGTDKYGDDICNEGENCMWNSCLDDIGPTQERSKFGVDVRLLMGNEIEFYEKGIFVVVINKKMIKGLWKCMERSLLIKYPGSDMWLPIGK